MPLADFAYRHAYLVAAIHTLEQVIEVDGIIGEIMQENVNDN